MTKAILITIIIIGIIILLKEPLTTLIMSMM